MNKTLLKRQLKQQLLSWKMLLIVLIGIGLTALEFKTTNQWKLIESYNFLHYVVVFDRYSVAAQIYLIVLPLLAGLLGGGVYSIEKHSGRLNLMKSRIPLPEIVKTTSISSFLLGGIASIIPIMISMLGALIYMPAFKFLSPFKTMYPIFTQDFWGFKIYEHSQILMVLILLLLLFIFGGLIAITAMSISFYSKVKHIEVLLPFVGLFVWYLVVSLIGFPELGHIVFLDFPITEGFRHTPMYLAATYVVLLLVNVYLLNREVKNDDLD
jgi:hypothetical protein